MALPYRPRSTAAERNREPILQVLRELLRGDETVLEIGSGTGQHAVYFARHLPGLTWLASDLPEHHPVIDAWLAAEGLANVRGPLTLDVRAGRWLEEPVDVVFSANTAHIMSPAEVRAMFAGAGRLLPPGGLFALYGPFNRDGEYTSDSNRLFDQALRADSAERGLRDLAELRVLAAAHGLQLEREFAMPANNLLLAWRRVADSTGQRED